ncbi:protein of unknown function [Xenorhabdus doucetiae]|uniref:Uncharacterized protein n=1 Tax=Xenorhabdus doucetiae TaxID=351671 RepID=A0A068QTM1_9GAMM|nr:protein of unknown function [Xenorhabdus doucetiae]
MVSTIIVIDKTFKIADKIFFSDIQKDLNNPSIGICKEIIVYKRADV